jgi:tetratricopeptide (TPR) repeat protein
LKFKGVPHQCESVFSGFRGKAATTVTSPNFFFDPRADIYLCLQLAGANSLPPAVRLLRLALGVDDDDPDKLAWADLISAFIVGDYESAIEMADRAVALNPNFISGVERKGLGL